MSLGYGTLVTTKGLGFIPCPVMGTTRDDCRHVKAISISYSRATAGGMIDLKLRDLSRLAHLQYEPLMLGSMKCP